MSAETDPNVHLLEETKRQINRLFEEVSRFAEADITPQDFYGEFLTRTMHGLMGAAGAVWLRTAQGNLQLQHQVAIQVVGLHENNRQSHDELLRTAMQKGRPMHVPPHSSTAGADGGSSGGAVTAISLSAKPTIQVDGGAVAGNPTGYDVLLAPVKVEEEVVGLVEVWLTPNRNPHAFPGFLQFLTRMAHFASLYTRNHRLRTMVGQQQVWTQLEAFARQVHGSLNPTEVSYMVANEGRRLVECDRVSVGLRHGRKIRVEAISGADVVERRSNLVQLMRKLLDQVIRWGEKLTYSGTEDDTLPPKVRKALDDFLAESNSKFLIVLPLKDERESESKKPPRSALLVESFEPSGTPEQTIARTEVVGRHATSALYNAIEHKRIPGRWIWVPLAKVQEGLGGKARAIIISVAAAVVLVLLAFIFVPYPLKMESKGQILPVERRYIYSPVEGRVVAFPEAIKTGAHVAVNQPIVLLHDLQLEMKLVELKQNIIAASREIQARETQLSRAKTPEDTARFQSEITQFQQQYNKNVSELRAVQERAHTDEASPGDFRLLSPIDGTVLTRGFEEMIDKRVRPSDPIMRVGNKSGRWEVELKIPQKHIGQVLQAYKTQKPDEELDVDILLASHPTQTYKGKLARRKIAGEANPNKEDANEADPVVLASVRIDGPGIETKDRVPETYLLSGTEVHSKIRCGKRAMGYSLLYGLWEFFYEKVVFFF